MRSVRPGLDLNHNGQLDLVAADRINDSVTLDQQDSALDWWRVSTPQTYPDSGSALPVVTGITQQRRTGFTAPVTAESLNRPSRSATVGQVEKSSFLSVKGHECRRFSRNAWGSGTSAHSCP